MKPILAALRAAGKKGAWNTRAPSPVNATLLAALQGYLDRHQNEADGAGSKECECFECRTARATLASATPPNPTTE